MNALFEELKALVRRHPKRIMGALGALLLGTGVTAFGVAPLEASLDQPVVRQLVQEVQPALVPAPDSLDAPVPFVLFRSDVMRRDDTAQSLLRRLGVNDSQASQFLRTDPVAANLFKGRTDKLVSAEANDQQQLLRLTARWLPSEDSSTYTRLVIERPNGGWVARQESAPFTTSVRLSSGTIQNSLFAATDAARLPDHIASQLADLFSGDIDFRRDLRTGDRFSVVYEAYEANGEVLKYGRLLSAEFINQGKAHQVLWFQEPGQKGAYFSFDGKSTKRAFLASPLAFSRVSSGYGMRFHPISGNQKAHLGVDFAAPIGTPVRSVGDGTVKFAGWQNGYGNVIQVLHRQDKITVYAHLSRINVRQGQRVEQSDVIGLVGNTGASTGPHLHFEYKEHNAHRDPMTLARQSDSQSISVNARKAFAQAAQSMRQKLVSAASFAQASAE